MIPRTVELSPGARDSFDAIIDVRSPAEFALDHIPGAINLPVLDDAQRTAVGTEYVQGSKFLARRSGAAMVARNIAAHLEGALAARGGGFRPLVYCWRGGQRSGAMVTVMEQVGWPVTLLDGGYQRWRRQVKAAFYDTPLPHRLVLLDGPTGSGKTALLAVLSGKGVQTIDLLSALPTITDPVTIVASVLPANGARTIASQPGKKSKLHVRITDADVC